MGTKTLCARAVLPCILATHACALPTSTREPGDERTENVVAEPDAPTLPVLAPTAPSPEPPAGMPLAAAASAAPVPSAPTDAAPEASASAASSAAPAVASGSDVGECYTLQAHELEVAGDTTPHVVEVGEHYSCFYFDVPWPAGSQAVTVRALPGVAAHHLELFRLDDGQPAGKVLRQQPHCGIAPRVPLSIWGLGQQEEQRMPEGVGLELPDPSETQRLYLEVHYVNAGEPRPDGSGVEICLAPSPRPQVAGVFDLDPGSFALAAGQPATITATCTPAYQGDIHVFRSFPHMHARGRSFRAEVARANGLLEEILDVAYDVSAQRTYDLDVVLRSGDRLLSHCSYVNDTNRVLTDGFTSDDEMCINFVYAWPAGSLTNGALGLPGGCFY